MVNQISRCTEIITLMLGFPFHIFCADSYISLNLAEEKVFKCYEKIEFLIKLDKTFASPFDAVEEEIFLEITKPNGDVVKLPAFYMQRFEFYLRPRGGRNMEWLYPSGNGGWFARYSGNVEGEYSAYAVYKTPVNRVISSPVKFKCLGGDDKGFIRVSRRNPGYFEHENGDPFFSCWSEPCVRRIRSVLKF